MSAISWTTLGLVLAVAALSLSLFVVDEREEALTTEFGRIVRWDYDPGLHFKLPVLQRVRKFDARLKQLTLGPNRYLTREKMNLRVTSFILWRIVDAKRFFEVTKGHYSTAESRLRALAQSHLRSEFAARTVSDIVARDRSEIMEFVLRKLRAGVTNFGIRIVDARLKRVDLPEAAAASVFDRMAAERREVAARLRARGEASAAAIRAQALGARDVILAKARSEGLNIRGRGDAAAAAIYARAFRRAPGFFAFYRSLAAYRAAFDDRSDVLVLEPKRKGFWNYFDEPAAGEAGTGAGASRRHAAAPDRGS